MEAVKNYACLTCKAPLAFNPETQKWDCDYCFNSFDLVQLEAAPSTSQKEDELDIEQPEMDMYHCQNCGADLLADETTAATFCLYCKSPSVLKSRFTGRFQPKFVIPFKLSQVQAETLYKQWIKKRFFTPDAFKHKEKIEEIKGIYAPFWMFDSHIEGVLDGEGTVVSTWQDSHYRYTKTQYYQVYREGTIGYEKVPVDASVKLDDAYMHKIEPYDYQALVPFNMQYMSGFLAERYDLEAFEAQKTMLTRVQSYATEKFKRTVTQYHHLSVKQEAYQAKDIEHQYTLMPIYLLNNLYNGKNHMFIINGQTGKVVGETPISNQKRFIFATAVFAAVWAVSVFGGAFFV